MDENKENSVIVALRGGGSIVANKILFGHNSELLLCSSGKNIKVFSTISGDCVHELIGHDDMVTSIALFPGNPHQILSASADKTVMKWDYTEGIQLNTFPCKYPFVALHTSPHTSLVLAVRQLANQDFDLMSFKVPSSSTESKLKGSLVLSHVTGRENAVAFGCSGKYAASVNDRNIVMCSLEDRKSQEHWVDAPRHSDKKFHFTCVACHPTDVSVASGVNDGRIILWYNFMSKKKVTKTVLHWHALPVMDLCYTAEGSYLLSGGHECVLVKWQLNTDHRDTLPRLGSVIVRVACSKQGTYYATSHSDNSIQLIGSNFKVLQHYQGLTMAYLGQQLKRLIPVGLQLDPKKQALVTNGRPGHLQFYSLQKDKQLFNLDIVGQNYISPENLDSPLVLTEVENAAFDHSGSWLATIERRDDGQTSVDMKLKFWKYSVENQSFALNTSIDLPHREPVHTLKFRSTDDNTADTMAVTTSEDSKFKLWRLADDSDIYRSHASWCCESVGYYRDLPAGSADFSQDGSLLAVAFGRTLTLWEPDTNALKHTFSMEEQICSVAFGCAPAMGYLVVATDTSLVSWNLLSLSVSWCVPLHVSVLVKSPQSDLMAAFTTSRELYVFSPKQSNAVYKRDKVSKHDIVAAIFVPSRSDTGSYDNNSSLSWQNKERLYYVNSQQELLTLVESGEEKAMLPVTTGVQNLPETMFSLLMTQKNRPHGETKSVHSPTQSVGQTGSQFLKQMLSTPSHVQAPVSKLCKTFLSTMIHRKQEKSPIEDQTEKEYATSTQMDQSTVSSDEDMDVTENLIGQPTKLISSELKQLSLTDANTEQIDSVRLKRFKTLKGLIL